MISPYKSSLYAERFNVSCFSAFEADEPDPPLHAKLTNCCLLNFICSLFLFVLFIRLLILVLLATAFRADFGQQVENFYIKIDFVEPKFPKSVDPDI